MKRVMAYLKRLHRCEGGAEGLEKILIIAAVVLPLLALLIYFRDYITEWVGGEVTEVRTDSDAANDQPF